MQNGSVALFILQCYQYASINLVEFCIDQATVVCATKLFHPSDNICILTIYRAPTGNLS
jgi:hypothetical protein